MRVAYERCCGIDVHKKMVVACVITSNEEGRAHRESRSFGTMMGELQALVAWLHTQGCTHVAMESTGVYWKPVYNVLEGEFELLVVNAEHIKKVPGHKTDVSDAEWLADLLRHGLLKGSFIPARWQRALRDLTRYRTRLVAERSSEVNRLQKVLEDANIKLASVATDIMGVSGRLILQQLLAGEANPSLLADLAKGRLREKHALLEQALQGKVTAHHRFMLIQHLSHIDYLDEAIHNLDQEIAQQTHPFEQQLARWDQLPGVSRRIAEIILAEVGADLQQFPDAKHLASWAGLCPGNHRSAGKRQSGKTTRGSPWLRAALTEAAHGAARTRHSYYQTLYHRLAARRGIKRAAIAVAHSLLVTGYCLVTRQEDYHDLGPNYFDSRHPDTVKRHSIKRLEQLGFAVTLTPLPPS